GVPGRPPDGDRCPPRSVLGPESFARPWRPGLHRRWAGAGSEAGPTAFQSRL
ncbi:MAG: hypothetical protein AVDCRST_MAG07-1030, partial [uncultured Frankineae bacterium]